MSIPTDIGFGIINKISYNYSDIESLVIDEGFDNIGKTKYENLYFVHNRIDDEVSFVFGLLKVVDDCCCNEVIYTFDGPNSDYLKTLKEDFNVFLKNKDLPENLKDIKNWKEGFFLKLSE